MEFFRSSPFLRILPAFCIGVLFNIYSALEHQVFSALLLVGITGVVISLIRKKTYSNNLFAGIFFQLIFLSFGFFLSLLRDNRQNDDHFSKLNPIVYRAKIIEEPEYRSGKWRAEAEIFTVQANQNWIHSSGKSFLYMKDRVSINDEVIFSEAPELIKGPINPGAFDFRFYSSLKRIYYQVRLNEDQYRIIKGGYSLKKFAVGLRNNFLAVYKSAGLSGREYAVMSALVLGYDDEIDTEVMKAFSASGTLHILSVSGMHVGIIFAALSFILKFAERGRTLKIIRMIILLLSLWFYALLTGLSPSVIRSAMMFSFILLGRNFSRSSGIYNSLSITALTIFLAFDPILLLQPGFQLSFIAVAGIAYFYQKIYDLYFFTNTYADKIYSLIAVSLAAQLATFPISIYYFHQFPNYFILANLIIIPLSTIAIFGGIGLLFINQITFLFVKVGWLCSKIILLLNWVAICFENLPGSVWTGITISLFQVFILMLGIILLTEFFGEKNLRLLRSALYAFILFFSISIADSVFRIRKHEIIFFGGMKGMCFQYQNGNNALLVYTSSDSSMIERVSDGYCNYWGYDINYRKQFVCNNENHFNSEIASIEGEMLIVGNGLIQVSPKSVHQEINPLAIYTENIKDLKGEDLASENILFNRNVSLRTNTEIGSNVTMLKESAKRIDLRNTLTR